MLIDNRQAQRKILRVKAVWTLDGRPPVAVRTIDLTRSGVSIHVDERVKDGALGQISFDIYVDGIAHTVFCKVAVTHCIFGGGEFKAGLQFRQLDATTTAILARFIR